MSLATGKFPPEQQAGRELPELKSAVPAQKDEGRAVANAVEE